MNSVAKMLLYEANIWRKWKVRSLNQEVTYNCPYSATALRFPGTIGIHCGSTRTLSTFGSSFVMTEEDSKDSSQTLWCVLLAPRCAGEVNLWEMSFAATRFLTSLKVSKSYNGTKGCHRIWKASLAKHLLWICSFLTQKYKCTTSLMLFAQLKTGGQLLRLCVFHMNYKWLSLCRRFLGYLLV